MSRIKQDPMRLAYNKFSGIAIIISLTLIPLFLWLPYANFSNTKQTLLTIGQALGLTGSILFSINFILSGRFKFLEPFFGGLNRIYITHHTIGAIAFIFLLYHPVFITLFYVPISVVSAAKILFSTPSNLPIFLGMIALLVIIITLIITFFIKLPYNIWKYTHKFLGLALFFATLHIYLIPSTVSKNPYLRYYILSIALLGTLSYLYRVIFYRFLVKRLSYTVSQVRLVNQEVTEIILTPQKNHFNYLPGQFIFINFSSLRVTKEVHPFSLTSAPSYPYLSLAVKSSGDYSETLKLLKMGAIAQVEGPFGYFTYSRYSTLKQLWIAGGIGITTFLGMARSLTPDTPYAIILYYVVGTPEEAVYLNELQTLTTKVANFKIYPYFSKTRGRISAETIANTIFDYKLYEIFLCGPPPMMNSLRSQFRKLGIKNFHIHSEEFSLE